MFRRSSSSRSSTSTVSPSAAVAYIPVVHADGEGDDRAAATSETADIALDDSAVVEQIRRQTSASTRDRRRCRVTGRTLLNNRRIGSTATASTRFSLDYSRSSCGTVKEDTLYSIDNGDVIPSFQIEVNTDLVGSLVPRSRSEIDNAYDYLMKGQRGSSSSSSREPQQQQGWGTVTDALNRGMTRVKNRHGSSSRGGSISSSSRNRKTDSITDVAKYGNKKSSSNMQSTPRFSYNESHQQDIVEHFTYCPPEEEEEEDEASTMSGWIRQSCRRAVEQPVEPRQVQQGLPPPAQLQRSRSSRQQLSERKVGLSNGSSWDGGYVGRVTVTTTDAAGKSSVPAVTAAHNSSMMSSSSGGSSSEESPQPVSPERDISISDLVTEDKKWTAQEEEQVLRGRSSGNDASAKSVEQPHHVRPDQEQLVAVNPTTDHSQNYAGGILCNTGLSWFSSDASHQKQIGPSCSADAAASEAPLNRDDAVREDRYAPPARSVDGECAAASGASPTEKKENHDSRSIDEEDEDDGDEDDDDDDEEDDDLKSGYYSYGVISQLTEDEEVSVPWYTYNKRAGNNKKKKNGNNKVQSVELSAANTRVSFDLTTGNAKVDGANSAKATTLKKNRRTRSRVSAAENSAADSSCRNTPVRRRGDKEKTEDALARTGSRSVWDDDDETLTTMYRSVSSVAQRSVGSGLTTVTGRGIGGGRLGCLPILHSILRGIDEAERAILGEDLDLELGLDDDYYYDIDEEEDDDDETGFASEEEVSVDDSEALRSSASRQSGKKKKKKGAAK